MAQLVRSAKSGGDWTANELAAYNFTVVYQDFTTFEQRAINPNVLTTLNHNDAPDDDTYKLLRILDLSLWFLRQQKIAVIPLLGHEPRGRTLRTRRDLSLVARQKLTCT
jgi:hypothetical protein